MLEKGLSTAHRIGMEGLPVMQLLADSLLAPFLALGTPVETILHFESDQLLAIDLIHWHLSRRKHRIAYATFRLTLNLAWLFLTGM